MAFLEMNGVHKGFGPRGLRTDVLQDVNLHIDEGEFVAIVGYSGAGKTTLISMIAGLQRPDTGTVKLKGTNITEPGSDRGMVFQNYSLLPWMTVYENIHLAVDQMFPTWANDKKRAHTERYIAMVNLTPAREKRPGELSGGMRQRVSLARALAIEPEILLLDEPLGALDALTRATLQDEIVRIWEKDKRTVVLITNDVDEGIYMADRIVPLSAGPRATLGPSVAVNISRPRDRKALNHDPQFRLVRKEVVNWLLGEGGKQKTEVTRKLVLPDLIPEDISRGKPMFAFGRQPKRRSEIKRETVEVTP